MSGSWREPTRLAIHLRRCAATLLALGLAALLSFAGLAIAQSSSPSGPGANFNDLRNRMVDQIAFYTNLSRNATGVDAIDKAILDVMREVPRHEFVPENLKPFAYLDTPLPVGHDQNIAQPFLVALMTHLVRIAPTDVVFETGTGAGYHAAILSKLAAKICSVETIRPLADTAAKRLERLGYRNVTVRSGDGFYGWRECGPYDVMIIKEAIHHVPAPLLNQLRAGGRMIAPIGPLDGTQHLTLIEKRQDGTIAERRLIPVKFSPLQGGERI